MIDKPDFDFQKVFKKVANIGSDVFQQILFSQDYAIKIKRN